MTDVDGWAWTAEAVRSASPARYVSAALASDDEFVVGAWLDAETSDARLVVGREPRGGWTTNEVVRADGAHTSMVIDTDGTISIAYIDVGRSAVMLATSGRTRADWSVETVVQPLIGFVATRPVAALTPTQSIEVCFASDDGLVVAVRSGQHWTVRPVDADVRSGVDVDFVVDATGHRHVVSRDPFTQALVYHHSDADGTTWDHHDVPWRSNGSTDGLLGDGPSLAVGPSGIPFVACWTDEGVGVATRAGQEWTFDLALARSVVMPSPALELTSDERPVIAVQAASSSALPPEDGRTGIVYVIQHDGTAWSLDEVSAPEVGRGYGGPVGLAIDARDGLRVAFVDDADGSLSVADLNRPPDVPDFHFETGVDTAFDEVNLLAGTIDLDGDAISLVTTPVQPPEHGTVRLRADGRCAYRPDRGFRGRDHFRFEVRDSRGVSAFGDVTVDVVVPDLLTVELRAYPTPQRPSRLVVDITSDKFRHWTATLQRQAAEQWIDVRTNPATNLQALIQPEDDEWASGPYRVELRRRSGTNPYSITRSEVFEMPPRRGYEVTVRGNVGHIGVPN